jgi:murein DD-endopeptidase MepM/ murein hydrolase activator NlpD
MQTNAHARRRSRLLALACVALALLVAVVAPAWAVDAAFVPGDGSSQLSLPIPVGETWTLAQGPHNTAGGLSSPLSSLDFAGGSGHVVAAAAGVVEPVSTTACAHPDPSAGLVVINHGNGWHTSYYHLRYVQVVVGQVVRRGQWLGDTGAALPCGGAAVGNHTHFSVEYYTSGTFMFGVNMVDVRGLDLGGWTVSGVTHAGCLTRDGDLTRVCSGQSGLVNQGIVG